MVKDKIFIIKLKLLEFLDLRALHNDYWNPQSYTVTAYGSFTNMAAEELWILIKILSRCICKGLIILPS